MAVRKDLPNRNRGRATFMPVHFPQVNPVSRQRPRMVEGAGARPPSRVPDSVSLGFFFATRTPVPARTFTGLAAAVQLRLRVAFGLQTLTVKSRLLTGENSVRIRGDPPFLNAEGGGRRAEFHGRRCRQLSLSTPRSKIRISKGIRGEIMIILRFERRVCRWESCRMRQSMPR